MFYGHRLDMFLFEFSFIGWWILGLFTCNILNIVYTLPYSKAAVTEYIADLCSRFDEEE